MTVRNCMLAALLCSTGCVPATGSVSIRFKSVRGAPLATKTYDAGCALFGVSTYLQNAMVNCAEGMRGPANEREELRVELSCEPKVFDMAVRLLDKGAGWICASADDIVGVLLLSERLMISKGVREALYKELYKLVCSNSGSGGAARRQDRALAAKTYMLRLLRKYAKAYGTDARVAEGRATLCPTNWYPQQHGSTAGEEAVGELRVSEGTMNKIILQGAMRSLDWFMDTLGVSAVNVAGCRVDMCVVELIQSVKGISMLNMSSSSIEPGCLGRLLQYIGGLADLDVSWCNLCRADLADIGKAWRLTRLVVSGCKIPAGSLPSLLRELCNLEELDVSHNELTSKDLLAIRRVGALRRLGMSRCSMDPGCLAHLSFGLESLRVLDISHNDLSWVDLQAIGRVWSLEKLDISECRIEEGGVENLWRLGRLEELYMPGSKLSSSDILGMRKMRSLRILSMRRCKMDAGCLRHAFREMRGLRDLDVSHNELDKDDLKGIGETVSLERLDIRCCKIATGCVSHLQGLGNLRELHALHCNLSSEDLLGIGSMKSLTKLNILGCKMEALSLGHLAGLESLKELNVSYSNLCEYEIQEIGRLKNLTKLWVRDCKMALGSLKHLLCGSAGIEELDISYNCLCAEDFAEVGRKKSLVELSIRNCDIEPGSLRHLQAAEGLRVLHALGLSGLSTEDEDVLCKLRLDGVRVYQS